MDDGLNAAEQAYFDSAGAKEPEVQQVTEAPEKAPETPETPETQEPEQKTVPYQALAEERQRRKELQRKDRENAEKLARLEGRLEALHKVATQPEVVEKPRPTLEQDALGYVKATGEDVQTVKQELENLKLTRQQEAEAKQFAEWTNTQVNQFKAQKTDYDDAISFLKEQRSKEYEDQGYDTNQINQLLNRDEYALINAAAQTGRNPASFAYALALEQGYTPKQAAAKVDAQEKIEILNKGQKASTSLSSTPGAAGASLSLEQLANMSEDEFADAVKGDKWRKFFA